MVAARLPVMLPTQLGARIAALSNILANQNADFGALTLASAGGFKPYDSNGNTVNLLSVDDQTGATRTWSINGSGALVADGTPDVDDGLAITCSHAGGSVVLTINSQTNCWSVASTAELKSALSAWKSSPINNAFVRGREGDFEMHDGVDTTGFINGINSAGGTDRLTITSHRTDKLMRFYNTSNTFGDASSYLTFTYVIFYMTQAYASGAGSRIFLDWETNATDSNEVTNCVIGGEAYSESDYNDVNLFTPFGSATGDLSLPIPISMHRGKNWKINNNTISHVNRVFSSLALNGACEFKDNTVDVVYYDNLRFVAPSSANRVAGIKYLTGNEFGGAFGVADEMGGSEPHVDTFQIFNDTGGSDYAVTDMVLASNISWGSQYRADDLQTILIQSPLRDCVIANNMLLSKSSAWGCTVEAQNSTTDSILISRNTFANQDTANTAATIRLLGDNGRSTVYKNATVGNFLNSAPASTQNLDSSDNDFAVNWGANFSGADNPTNAALALAMATPDISSSVDTNGTGAVGTDGALRTLAYGPRDSMGAATLDNTGLNDAELKITRAAAPTKTEGGAITGYLAWYRQDGGVSWDSVDMGTSSPYTATLPLAGVTYDIRTQPYIAGGIPGQVGSISSGTTAGTATFQANAVYNNSDTYLNNFSFTDPTSGATAITVSYWYKNSNSDNDLTVYQARTATGQDRIRVRHRSDGSVQALAYNSSNTAILNVRTAASQGLNDGNWHHIIISADFGASPVYRMKIDAATPSGTFQSEVVSNDSIGSGSTRQFVFSDQTLGGDLMDGSLSEVFMDAAYYDLSVGTVLDDFIVSDGGSGFDPVDLAGYGTPYIYLSGYGANFAVNGGSGENLNIGGPGSDTLTPVSGPLED